MTPQQHWQAVQEVFEAALEQQAADRDAFVTTACKGDQTLRREVLSLLAAYDESDNIDAQAQAWLASVSEPLAMPSLEGRRIGPYRVLREVGVGGMGAVYLAERADGQFEQQVALKLLRPGLASQVFQQRFLYERQILARLQHAHIARLLDGGVTEDGQPYFAMEYVEGRPIDVYCDARQLGISARLTLFMDVCRAVAYAHRNLVVHRDLKPSNILVTDEGAVKLLDFGIAKLLEREDEALETRPGLQVMTPEYAAPEQIRGQAITTETDVYSLGVILYELLAGRRPYAIRGLPPSDVERVICKEDVEKPSTAVSRGTQGPPTAEEPAILLSITRARGTVAEKLRRRLTGDLDTIVLKALHKEPGRRYASATELQEDLERHLAGLPVRARPDTWGYRARAFIRRHRAGVAAAVLVVGALLAGLAGTTWQARRATRQARLASNETAKAQQVSAFLIELFRVSDPNEALGDTITAREILDQGAIRIEKDLADQPEVQATMSFVIGQVYQALGLHEAARPLLEQSLRLRRATLGSDHVEVAASLNQLGMVWQTQGQLDSARTYHEAALAMRRKLLGETHPDVAVSLNNLAVVLQISGAYAEATLHYREALKIRRALLGDVHEDVAVTLSNLGWCLQAQGDLAAADTLFREALAIRRTLYGEAHPHLARSLHALSTVLYEQGELEASESLAREALAMRRTLQGETHPDVGDALLGLANVLGKKGAYTEAEAYYREALAVWRAAFGEEDLRVARVSNDLAGLLREQGAYERALPLYQQALTIYRKKLGNTHLFSAIVQGNVASTLQALGDYDQAESLYREALDLLRSSQGPEHPRTIRVTAQLGELFVERGKHTEAEPLLRSALEVQRRTLPEGDEGTARTESALGACLTLSKRYEEAEALLLRSYAVLQERRGAQDRYTRRALEHLAALYDAWDKPAEAARYRTLLADRP